MTDQNWALMDEKTLENVLESSVSEFPPEDVAAEITPWKRAMRRILAGMALCAVTLNFWNLNYALPAIGIVLLLLGARALRRENKWFQALFVITGIRAVCFFPPLILNTTIFQGAVLTAPATLVLTAVSALLLLAGVFCLRGGLRAVQKKAGLPPRAGGTVALIIWYVLMYILAAIAYKGLIIGGVMIAGYFFIIRSIYRLSRELDEAGYAIQAARNRITDGCIALVFALALLTGCVFGYLFGGSYPMQWTAVDPAEQAQVQDVKAQLLELGFPEYVLNDLTAEDMASCEGAVEVVVQTRDEDVRKHSGIGNVRLLHMTGVGVRLSGEGEEWRIFHHFLWPEDYGFYGTECIQLWPVYRKNSEFWAASGEVTGRVLYDKSGERFSAAYYQLEEQTYTADSMFWGEQTNTDIFAAFSLPAKGSSCRGYLAYSAVGVQEGFIINDCVNYTHQQSWFQYPAVTAMEMRKTGSWTEGAFQTFQEQLFFDLREEN